MIEKLDLRPRRVWLGLVIPGKKMMALLMPKGGIQRGRELIDLYQDKPHMALMSAAITLHELPRSETPVFGPALRDLTKPIDSQSMLYRTLWGAILTDLRDFLKLRFRTKGLADTEPTARAMLDEILGNRNIQEALDTSEDRELVVSYVVNYVITALDALSRGSTISGGNSGEDFVKSFHILRDYLRATARSLYPYGPEQYNQGIDSLFTE